MAIKLSKNGKRLGRPPKNNSGTVFISQVKTVSIAKEEKPSIIDTESMIECELLPIPQYSHLKESDTKHGRYMTSIYTVDGFGSKKWIVGAYLKTDWSKYRIIKMGDKQIIERCINYLNSLGSRKRKYGNLSLYTKDIKFLQKNGQEVAVVELITDDRKNENFWGEGEKV